MKSGNSKSIKSNPSTLHLPTNKHNVQLYGTQIPSSSTVKYFGLTLDRRLTWAYRIKTKSLQLNFRPRTFKMIFVNNIRTNLNIKLLVYRSLLKPIWNHGLRLWENARNLQSENNPVLSITYPKKYNKFPAKPYLITLFTQICI